MNGEKENTPTPNQGGVQKSQEPSTHEKINPKVPHILESESGAKAPNIGDQEKEENLHEIKMDDQPTDKPNGGDLHEDVSKKTASDESKPQGTGQTHPGGTSQPQSDQKDRK